MIWKQFTHLGNFPPELKVRFNSFLTTEFDDSLSVEMQFRSIIKWCQDNFKTVDTLIDFINDISNWLKQFENNFDTKLEDSVISVLSEWQANGKLDVVISEALQWQLDDYIATNEQDKLSITAQLAQITTHPLQYGAKGDGITNDTLPFTEAIDNLDNGYIVDLQGKNYLIDGVEINKKIILKNGTITLSDNALVSALTVTNLGKGTTLENLEIFVKKGNESYSSGILLNETEDITIKNCYVNGSRSMVDGDYHACISVYQSSNVSIINCTGENSHRENIYARDSYDVLIEGCKAINSGYSGVSSTNGERITVNNCNVTGAGATSISINSKHSIVTNNTVKDNTQFNGIVVGHELSDMGNCIVSNNLVLNSEGIGISVAGVESVVFNGNMVENSKSHGLLVIATKHNAHVVVSGNIVKNSGANGIRLFNYTTTMNIIANGNNIELTKEDGFNITTGGTVNLSNNTIKDTFIGVNVGGRATQSLGLVSTLNNIMLQSNIISRTKRGAFQVTNANQLKISNNILETIATNTELTSHVISVYGLTSTVPVPFPHITINGNEIKDVRGVVGRFVFISNSSDLNNDQKELVILNNVVLGLEVTRLTNPLGTNIKKTVKGNKVGSDDSFFYQIIASGTTTTRIENSNITSFTPPLIMPRSEKFYDIKVYVSSISDGVLTLTHLAPDSAVGINILCM